MSSLYEWAVEWSFTKIKPNFPYHFFFHSSYWMQLTRTSKTWPKTIYVFEKFSQVAYSITVNSVDSYFQLALLRVHSNSTEICFEKYHNWISLIRWMFQLNTLNTGNLTQIDGLGPILLDTRWWVQKLRKSRNWWSTIFFLNFTTVLKIISAYDQVACQANTISSYH